MAIKVVEAGEPATEAISTRKVSAVLPRDEAFRLRRAVRSMADSLSPWALKGLYELAQDTADPKLKRLLLLDILSISMNKKSNEEIDPEAPTVDAVATKAEEEALSALESKTELGTGSDE